MKILINGCNGQLGTELQKQLKAGCSEIGPIPEKLRTAKQDLNILHPLPRVNEIAYDVDASPHAYYFEQARNGLYAREAILCNALGITLDEVRADQTIIL